MTRRGISDADRHDRAVQAARRMVSRGERPSYRLAALEDGSWAVDGLPGVIVTATGRREASDAARVAIAAALDVPADAFDLELA